MSTETVAGRKAPGGVVPVPLDPAVLEGPLWLRGPRPGDSAAEAAGVDLAGEAAGVDLPRRRRAQSSPPSRPAMASLP